MFETKVTKVDAKFSDRLYLVNNLMQQYAKATRAVWNNPMGGAMEWNFYPQNAIIDTKGEVRWYMHVEPIYNVETIYHSGVMMGFQQDEDGNITWGYGQRYVKYDLILISRFRSTMHRTDIRSSVLRALTTAVPTASVSIPFAT